MNPRYIILLDFSCGEIINIRLSEQQFKESEEFDDFFDFLSILEDKYEFRVKDCIYI